MNRIRNKQKCSIRSWMIGDLHSGLPTRKGLNKDLWIFEGNHFTFAWLAFYPESEIYGVA
jgi:hypothetical protein